MKLKKLTAAFSAAAVSLLGLAVVPAFAAEPAPGNVDAAKTGSITLHKYANPGLTVQANPDGTDADKFAGLTPIKGVKFSYQQIDVDLTTGDGWKTLKTYTAETAAQHLKGDLKNFADTDTNGMAKAEQLAVGAYLVKELDSPHASPTVKDKAADFIVTIPYSHKGDAWIYDVNVYPKNDINTKDPSKVLKTLAYKAGDMITWSFDLPVNPLTAGQTSYTTFGAYEILAKYLTIGNVENAKFVNAQGVSQDVTVSCEDTQKTLPKEKAGYENKVYKCSVKDSDLSKLRAGGKVTFDLATTLTSIPAGSAKVDQSFYPFAPGNDPFANGATPGDSPISTNTTEYFGKLEFTKVDKADATLNLKGAKFELHKQGGDGTACATPGDMIAEAESATDGKVTFDSVYVATATSNLEEDAVKALKATYCLVETQAPAGYKKAANISVEFTAGTVATGGSLGEAKFKNEKDTSLIPNLPLTGAAGSVILTLAGIALLAVAVGFGIRTARKNS